MRSRVLCDDGEPGSGKLTVGLGKPGRKPSAVPGDPAIDLGRQPHAAWHMKGERPKRTTGKSRERLTDCGGTGKNMALLVDQMKLIPAALSRYVWEAFFQVRLLEGDELELVPSIVPVDPPGDAPSEPSVAVIDDRHFVVLHSCRYPLVPRAPTEFFLNSVPATLRSCPGQSRPPSRRR